MLPGNTRKMDKTTVLEKVIGFLQKHNGNRDPLSIFLFLPFPLDDFIKLASLVPQTVTNLPAVQEARVQSLGWEDPMEKGMATHSSVLAWRIPWIEEPGGLQSMGS